MENRDSVAGLGEVLKSKRIAAGLSQYEASEKAKVSRPNLIGYEGGKRAPSLPVLYRLARAYGVPVGDLLPADDAAGVPVGSAPAKKPKKKAAQ